MNHGLPHTYTRLGCRCEPCLRAAVRAKKAWRLRTGSHTGHGPVVHPILTDSRPVAAHVAALVASGWRMVDIAEEVGVHATTIRRIYRGANALCRGDLAAAIRGLQPLEPVAVDEVVVRRLVAAEDWRGMPRTIAERDAAIRAADAAGISRAEIARRSHVNSVLLYRALNGEVAS